MYQSRGTGDSMASNYGSPSRGSRNLRIQRNNQFELLATVTEGSSDASSSAGSSSGGSYSQLGRNDARGGPMSPSRGQVDVQMFQAAQQLPTTPQHDRRMTLGGSSTSSPFMSPTHARTQAAQRYDGSPQKMTPRRVSQLQGSDTQRRGSHASQTSENWRSPRRPSFSSDLRAPAMAAPADTFNATSMSGVPEHLAVQELAFRQGQHDGKGARHRIPQSPFAKQFDVLWAEHYKLGAMYGGEPAIRPTAPPAATHDNFAWAILINPATQDLEHPNGTIDMSWTHKMCAMSLDCMQELIRVVCKRPNDWRKYVCDIPGPAQQAIVAFPDLCEYYEVLKRDAHQALSGGIPTGY